VTAERGFALYHATGTIYRGWVKVKSGDVTERTALLRSGLAAYRATSAESWVTNYITLLAVACEVAGQFGEALTRFDDALQVVERTGQRWVRSRAQQAQRPAAAATGAYRSRRGAISQSRQDRRRAGSQALGIARRREPRPAPSRPGSPRRSPRPPLPGLQLVHRGVRHHRSQRREGAARRTGVSRRLACADVRRECRVAG
jgi:hypothetical protein